MKGNISLSTVLVTSSILLLMGITLILSITDFTLSTKDYFNNEQNEVQSKACIEEALQKIKSDLQYEGSFTTNLGDGSCTIQIDINDSNLNYRDITITSNYNNYFTVENKRADISTNPFSIITN